MARNDSTSHKEQPSQTPVTKVTCITLVHVEVHGFDRGVFEGFEVESQGADPWWVLVAKIWFPAMKQPHTKTFAAAAQAQGPALHFLLNVVLEAALAAD